MEAAKRADSMLGASRQTTAHTIRDASTDVLKMVRDLIEKQTTQEISVRTAPTTVMWVDDNSLAERRFIKKSASMYTYPSAVWVDSYRGHAVVYAH